MFILGLAVLGLVGIAAGFVARRVSARRCEEDPIGPFARRLRWARWVGYGLGVATWPLTGLMSYPYAADGEPPGRIAGVPFPVAYFNSVGHDFIGAISLVSLVANALYWGLLPRLVVVCWEIAWGRSGEGAPTRAPEDEDEEVRRVEGAVPPSRPTDLRTWRPTGRRGPGRR